MFQCHLARMTQSKGRDLPKLTMLNIEQGLDLYGMHWQCAFGLVAGAGRAQNDDSGAENA